MNGAPAEPSQRVLLISYYFPPLNTSGAARPYRLFKFLPRSGYSVDVLTAVKQPGGGVPGVHHVPDTWGPLGANTRLDWTIRRLCFQNDGPTWIPRAAAAAARLCRAARPAAVISTSPSINTHLAALWVKRRYGVPWIADFRDPLAGNPFGDRAGRRVRVDAFLERLFFRRADLLLANTDALAETWRGRYPEWQHKIRVLWNGFDPEIPVEAAPLPPRPFRTLVHMGALYGKRHPGRLLASVRRLMGSGAVTPGHLRIRLVGMISRETLPIDLNEFRCLEEAGCLEWRQGTIPAGEALGMTAESDFQLLLDVQDEASVQLPAKLFDLVRIGRPILAFTSRNSPADRILAASGVPHRSIYPDHTDAEADSLIAAFLALPANPVRASDWFWEQFDGVSQASALAAMIDALAGRREAALMRSR